jgi:hypothetical protein
MADQVAFVQGKVKVLGPAASACDCFANQRTLKCFRLWPSDDPLPVDLDGLDFMAQDGGMVMRTVSQPADNGFNFRKFWQLVLVLY